MMSECELFSGKEIVKLAKNQSDIEIVLPKLTTDEISFLTGKIDSMISCSYSEKTRSELIQLRGRLTKEEYLRENIEVS